MELIIAAILLYLFIPRKKKYTCPKCDSPEVKQIKRKNTNGWIPGVGVIFSRRPDLMICKTCNFSWDL